MVKEDRDRTVAIHSAEMEAILRYGPGTTLDGQGRPRNKHGGEPGYHCLFTAEESERWQREMAK